ncbi:thiamine thiazole synthase, chloroplastic-like protein [Tanacetum coccineum]
MEGADRLNELKDDMLVNNIMSRLDCTTKELIRTTTTISKRWRILWTQLPHLSFIDDHDITDYVVKETDLHGYISFIDNTLNQCPSNLNLKKIKLDTNHSSLIISEFKSRANSWIRYAISRNVEDVDLRCRDEDMIEKILSRSPCLESLELNECNGYRQIDIRVNCKNHPCEGVLVLRELVLLDVSSLVKVDLDYSINWRESKILDEEVFDKVLLGLFESLGHVEDITFGDQCSELVVFRGSDTSDDKPAKNGAREDQITSND